jgi:hypothetical protein
VAALGEAAGFATAWRRSPCPSLPDRPERSCGFRLFRGGGALMVAALVVQILVSVLFVIYAPAPESSVDPGSNTEPGINTLS